MLLSVSLLNTFFLQFVDFFAGSSPPLVHRAGAPIIDERGLWIDLDFSYEGLVALNIQTKINLLKLKEPPDEGN